MGSINMRKPKRIGVVECGNILGAYVNGAKLFPAIERATCCQAFLTNPIHMDGYW